MGHYSAVVRRHWSTDCICKSTNSSTPLFALHELNSYSDPLRQPNAPVEFAESGAISSFLRKYVLTFAPKEGRRYTARIGVKTRQLSHFATPTRREPAEVGTNVSLAHLHKRVLAIPHRTPSRHIRSSVPRSTMFHPFRRRSPAQQQAIMEQVWLCFIQLPCHPLRSLPLTVSDAFADDTIFHQLCSPLRKRTIHKPTCHARHIF